jgi:hypothetical protein
MIIETIFSTLDKSGKTNFAPMGLVWGDEIVVVRPFRSTRTFQNLRSSGCGVASLSDNTLAYARCALFDENLPSFPAIVVPGSVYQEACSWLELKVLSCRETDDRCDFECQVVHKGRQRDFLGYCRAGNAVIEAIILATRLPYLDLHALEDSLNHYSKIVEKTGSATEKDAFRLVCEYIQDHKAPNGRHDD